MNKKRIIKLTKLEEVPDPVHSNNIPTGNVYYGTYQKDPIVGDRFDINAVSMRSGMRGFSTSGVLEILSENTFRTYNSIYKWEDIPLHEVPGFTKLGETVIVKL